MPRALKHSFTNHSWLPAEMGLGAPRVSIKNWLVMEAFLAEKNCHWWLVLGL